MHVDNEAVAILLNSGASRAESLQDCLREIALVATSEQFVLKATYIMGI